MVCLVRPKINISSEQEKFIRDNYLMLNRNEIAQKLNLKPNTISYQMKLMGLTRFYQKLPFCRMCGKRAIDKADLVLFRKDNKNRVHGCANICRECSYKKYGWPNPKRKEYSKKYYDKQSVSTLYRSKPIFLLREKDTTCDGCNREKGKDIKKVDRHHWKYAYPLSEVRKNPILVLDYTNVFCFRCHKIGDSFRHIIECDDAVFDSIFSKIPEDMRQKLINRVNKADALRVVQSNPEIIINLGGSV